jgi:hypothetical protein
LITFSVRAQIAACISGDRRVRLYSGSRSAVETYLR